MRQSIAISTVLPLPANLDIVQLVVTEEYRGQGPFSVTELLVLGHVWRERTLDTTASATLLRRSDAEVRATLESLV